MTLEALLSGVATKEVRAETRQEIGGVCYDSRKAKAGDVFVAVRGYESDGHRYIGAAAEKGAVCAVCEEAPEADIPYVLVDDTRRALAVMAANWFGRPADSMIMVGVTGTNGKTTTTNLIKEILEQTTGETVGLIGTNRNMIGGEELPTERTTPESYELHALFRRMADAGCRYVVMEVSSHSLYLDRVYGIDFEVGVFTNLTEDHLDFHKTMEAYAAAKAKLFAHSRVSVINIDDKYAETMKNAAAGGVVTYSVGSDTADLTARDVTLKPDGVCFCVLTTGQLERAHLGIPGRFSVYNGMAALETVVSLGVPLRDAAKAMWRCKGVKGRAEVVPTGRDFTVLIDYAHTPDALQNILTTVNGFKKGRLVLVFGCGGDREKEKRPQMGRIAVDNADLVLITSDNPRTEDPEAIIREIAAGTEGKRSCTKIIPDRREAIAYALKNAKPDDIILLAGKGHETYQIIGTEKHHFDEREVVAGILSEIG